MRDTSINLVLSSNLDLTKASNTRVKITREDGEKFRVTSKLKVFKCERYPFVIKYLESKHGAFTHYTGNISAPKGLYWE